MKYIVKTKPIDQVVDKWQRKVSGAEADYRAGIENPREDWEAATKAAEARYKEGVTRAANEGRFGRGVSRAGTEKWKKGASQKGPARWSSGVSMAQDEYRSGMSDVLNTIESVSLPPRGAAGDPRNYERVKAIGEALHKKFKGR